VRTPHGAADGTAVAPALRAYAGPRADEHLAAAGSPHTLAVYGSDTSGTKAYRFNSLGFRGEEHDPAARATIFVCGCSITFGTGLDAEETWAHRFKLGWAERRGLAPADVNLLNFSHGGASNDYIARTLVEQCARVRPTLVVAQFTVMNRAEAYALGEPFSIGLGLWPSWSLWWRFLGVPWSKKRMVFERMRIARGYARSYTPELGFANALRNILLLQSFCRARGIDCVMSWSDHWRLADERFGRNETFAPLVALLDRTRLCDFSIRDPDLRTDAAADGGHPGPRSNAAFAERLLAFHERQEHARA
jgi:hypothetical protein